MIEPKLKAKIQPCEQLFRPAFGSREHAVAANLIDQRPSANTNCPLAIYSF